MERIIGVDVSKDYLDADTLPSTQRRRFTNNPAGVAELVEWARPFQPERIVFESTGPYQKAAVTAIRHCPPMKEFYIRLKQRGKASKVALIAVARKILVLANALIRSMKPYDPANSVCLKNA
jgi:transposase